MKVRDWAIPVLTFTAITVWWLFPVLSNLSTVIPGSGAGDNVTFVWNVWWMGYVLHHPGQSFFFTPFLFHPAGVDLTLHTHTALPALIAVVLANGSPVAGQNAVILLHLFLNFVCTYALAYRATGRVMSAVLGAVIFGTSSYVSAHLNGHFNLIAAWTLPLGCLLMWQARESASMARGVLAGCAVAAVAYTDYYLFVYLCIVLALACITQSIRICVRHTGLSQRQRRLLVAVACVAVLDGLVIAGILLWPGDRVVMGRFQVSLRSVRNPITALWILCLMALVIGACSRIRAELKTSRWWRNRRAGVAMIATSALLLLPLLIHAAALWRSGGYVSQAYLWRSSPSGIDAASLVLGSPYHALWGEAVRGVYDRFHIDPIEACGWIPLSALALTLVGVASRTRTAETKQWGITGAMFMIWALGPWLTAFGRQTPLILPAIVVRFLPIVANARIPGRAMAVVHLAIAILAAIGFARLLSAGKRTQLMAWCLAGMLIIECLPSRPPLYTVRTPSAYRELKGATHIGAVCELPLGLRDGFGESGSLDEAVLLYQMVHERPLVGGFVARLPPAISRSDEAMPVIRSLLRLSSGISAADADISMTPHEAADMLTSAGIAFIVLDTRRASADLIEYVQSKIELRRVAEEDGRVFYEVM